MGLRVLYNAVSSSVRVNGWLIAFVHSERGLKQGCPLSMPLYVLTAETMAINIRSNPLIHGVKPPKSQNKVKYPSSLMTLPFYSRMSNQLLKPFVS